MKTSISRCFAFLFLCILVLTAFLGARSGPVSDPLNSSPINKVRNGSFDAPNTGKSGVLLLAPGLSIEDIQAEPTLARLVQIGTPQAALGLTPTRSGGDDNDFDAACQTLAWGARAPSAPRAPSLAATLRKNGVRIALLDPTDNSGGVSPARVLAGGGALVSRPAALRAPDPDAPDGYATDPERVARAAAALFASPRQISAVSRTPPGLQPGTAPPGALAVVVFDDLRRADAYAPLALTRATARQRQAALRRLGHLIALLTGNARRQTTPGALPQSDVSPLLRAAFVLLVAPVASRAAQERGERVAPVALWRRSDLDDEKEAPRLSLLTSPSTRLTPGLVANTDIAASVAALLGLPPGEQRIGAGRAAQTIAQSANPIREDGVPAFLARRAFDWAAQGREQRFIRAVPWLLAALLIAAPLVRKRRARFADSFHLVALSVPVALWIGATGPLINASVSSFAGAFVIAACAFALPHVWPRLAMRRAALAIAGLTCAVVCADTLAGGPLLARSPLSYSVQEAARFYGLGNEAEGVFLGAGLAVAGALGEVAFLAALFWVGTVCAVFALPRLGADAGGLAAALVGGGTLSLRHLKRRFAWTPRQTALVAGALVLSMVAALAVFAVLDARRGPVARSHIGEAIASASERGPAVLREIAVRKAQIGVRLFVSSPWSVLLVTEIVLLASALRWRPGEPLREPAPTQTAHAALFAAAAAALLLNDSGVVAASLCLLFAVPPSDPAKAEG